MAFADYFHDQALRIDYRHEGDARAESITLERLYRTVPWGRSKSQLCEPQVQGVDEVKGEV